MTLLICRTCPRYNTRSTGQFSRDLTDAIAADGRDITIRKVQCLGGCPDDGVAAVDGPGMTRVRFTSLTSHDAAAIITAALAHQTSTTGDPADWEIPPNSPPGSAQSPANASPQTRPARPPPTPTPPTNPRPPSTAHGERTPSDHPRPAGED